MASDLGIADVIFFGSSERGTGRRGLHSALENVYESLVAALYLDGGLAPAIAFVKRTLIVQSIARGVGRTKKESESQAAKSALEVLSSFFEAKDSKDKKRKADARAAIKAAKAEEKARRQAAQRAKKQKKQQQQ